MKINFENYLRDIHAEDYTGTDDDMPDAFDNWLTEIQIDDVIKHADDYATIIKQKPLCQ